MTFAPVRALRWSDRRSDSDENVPTYRHPWSGEPAGAHTTVTHESDRSGLRLKVSPAWHRNSLRLAPEIHPAELDWKASSKIHELQVNLKVRRFQNTDYFLQFVA